MYNIRKLKYLKFVKVDVPRKITSDTYWQMCAYKFNKIEKQIDDAMIILDSIRIKKGEVPYGTRHIHDVHNVS